MRGAGKTTTGGWAAKLLGWPFIDLDTELERSEGMTIPEMLKDNDWAGFRQKELRLLTRIMAEKPNGHIFATGGGIVETPEARQLLVDWQKEGMVPFGYERHQDRDGLPADRQDPSSLC